MSEVLQLSGSACSQLAGNEGTEYVPIQGYEGYEVDPVLDTPTNHPPARSIDHMLHATATSSTATT